MQGWIYVKNFFVLAFYEKVGFIEMPLHIFTATYNVFKEANICKTREVLKAKS